MHVEVEVSKTHVQAMVDACESGGLQRRMRKLWLMHGKSGGFKGDVEAIVDACRSEGFKDTRGGYG